MKKYLMAMFILSVCFLFLAITFIYSSTESSFNKTVDCYDRYANKIIGFECVEEKFIITDGATFCSGVTILIFSILGLIFVFNQFVDELLNDFVED